MNDFIRLIEISNTLLSPNGCPWDREQTLWSLQPYLLEETHELIEALDLKDGNKIAEELGDVLYVLIFISKLGEKEGLMDLGMAIRSECEKLIRRHPHVFGDLQVENVDQIVENWEAIKKTEGKKTPLEGIPESLPSLARVQKIIHRLKRAKAAVSQYEKIGEEELGEKLWDLVGRAEASGLDAESVLRRYTNLRK